MTWALILTSLGFGLRHGFDLDHIAAIADLSSNADDRRRGFLLSMMYAVGHGLVVFSLGAALLLVGATLPDSVDQWMGRVVGLTLILLGLVILVGLVRHGRDFRLRSRWMLVLDGTFAGVRKVRNATTRRSIAVEHEHSHEHVHEHGTVEQGSPSDDATPDQLHAHDHSHTEVESEIHSTEVARAPEMAASAGGASGRRRWPGFQLHGHHHGPTASAVHSHAHRHELALPDSPDGRYTGSTATGIGMIHGVGIESPTQIAVFVGASAAAGMASGLLLLSAWVLGLILANAALAVITGLGLLSAERNQRVYVAVAVVMAILSIALGFVYLSGGELG